MTEQEVLEFAKEAGLVSVDAVGFDHMQGDFMKFVEMVTEKAREEGFVAGQENVWGSKF